ncbi:MAG: exodeoxyribonuclease III [Deltaproteobacteria bacterium]|jgi:exodeoxyribonuclease-3|nr:exodeoxyribonuclease III [Deltaproteobacteria bacterium]
MRLISFNVNGLRAASAKPGFFDWFHATGADVIALQEIKARREQLTGTLITPGEYRESFFSSPTVKKGYSGVAVYSKVKPIKVSPELPWEEWAQEGRLLHLELPGFHFLNVYFPNGQRDGERLDYKLGYYGAFFEYAEKLRASKPVVVCGDFNTAHREIDLAQPELYEDTSGFLPQERAFLSKMIKNGYVDTFRFLNGDLKDQYTWWSYRSGDKRKNNGWRIDYFFASPELAPKLAKAWIEPKIAFSDHCPIGLELDA